MEAVGRSAPALLAFAGPARAGDAFQDRAPLIPEAPRDLASLRHEVARRALLPGPPPAFELSLLELERDLRHLLARLEATRAHDRRAGMAQVTEQMDSHQTQSAKHGTQPAGEA